MFDLNVFKQQIDVRKYKSIKSGRTKKSAQKKLETQKTISKII